MSLLYTLQVFCVGFQTAMVFSFGLRGQYANAAVSLAFALAATLLALYELHKLEGGR